MHVSCSVQCPNWLTVSCAGVNYTENYTLTTLTWANMQDFLFVCVQVFVDFSMCFFFSVFSNILQRCWSWMCTLKDTKRHTPWDFPSVHFSMPTCHLSLHLSAWSTFALACVCVSLRCAVSLTRCFHNTACLMPRGCIQVTPAGLSLGGRRVDSFSICRRARFHDLSNLQLTPLKVSYDLIETDYGDNSITHNRVG